MRSIPGKHSSGWGWGLLHIGGYFSKTAIPPTQNLTSVLTLHWCISTLDFSFRSPPTTQPAIFFSCVSCSLRREAHYKMMENNNRLVYAITADHRSSCHLLGRSPPRCAPPALGRRAGACPTYHYKRHTIIFDSTTDCSIIAIIDTIKLNSNASYCAVVLLSL